jgi:Flp pilus assembly pilin Flp
MSGNEEDRRQVTMGIRSSTRAMMSWFFGGDHAEGQAMVEYSLIFVLIVIVCFTIVTTVATTIDDKFFQIVQAMP